jgi:hypothetical protein
MLNESKHESGGEKVEIEKDCDIKAGKRISAGSSVGKDDKTLGKLLTSSLWAARVMVLGTFASIIVTSFSLSPSDDFSTTLCVSLGSRCRFISLAVYLTVQT